MRSYTYTPGTTRRQTRARHHPGPVHNTRYIGSDLAGKHGECRGSVMHNLWPVIRFSMELTHQPPVGFSLIHKFANAVLQRENDLPFDFSLSLSLFLFPPAENFCGTLGGDGFGAVRTQYVSVRV